MAIEKIICSFIYGAGDWNNINEKLQSGEILTFSINFTNHAILTYRFFDEDNETRIQKRTYINEEITKSIFLYLEECRDCKRIFDNHISDKDEKFVIKVEYNSGENWNIEEDGIDMYIMKIIRSIPKFKEVFELIRMCKYDAKE